MSMVKMLVKTGGCWTPVVLRLALGLVMFPHGAQKVLGWFGGYGFEGTMGFFTGTLHIPAVFAFLAIAAEFGGSLLLLAGAATRVAALGIGVTMIVAALKVHVANGFFMNWYGNQAGEGFEYHILAAAIALALVITGGGKASVDEVLTKKCEG
jgi:putative oxidoreductase